MNAQRKLGLSSCRRLFSLTLCLCLTWCCHGADWPQYRGTNHDGISTERINQQWTGSVTNPLWRLPPPNDLGGPPASGGPALTPTPPPVPEGCKAVSVGLCTTPAPDP